MYNENLEGQRQQSLRRNKSSHFNNRASSSSRKRRQKSLKRTSSQQVNHFFKRKFKKSSKSKSKEKNKTKEATKSTNPSKPKPAQPSTYGGQELHPKPRREPSSSSLRQMNEPIQLMIEKVNTMQRFFGEVLQSFQKIFFEDFDLDRQSLRSGEYFDLVLKMEKKFLRGLMTLITESSIFDFVQEVWKLQKRINNEQSKDLSEFTLDLDNVRESNVFFNKKILADEINERNNRSKFFEVFYRKFKNLKADFNYDKKRPQMMKNSSSASGVTAGQLYGQNLCLNSRSSAVRTSGSPKHQNGPCNLEKPSFCRLDHFQTNDNCFNYISLINQSYEVPELDEQQYEQMVAMNLTERIDETSRVTTEDQSKREGQESYYHYSQTHQEEPDTSVYTSKGGRADKSKKEAPVTTSHSQTLEQSGPVGSSNRDPNDATTVHEDVTERTKQTTIYNGDSGRAGSSQQMGTTSQNFEKKDVEEFVDLKYFHRNKTSVGGRQRLRSDIGETKSIKSTVFEEISRPGSDKESIDCLQAKNRVAMKGGIHRHRFSHGFEAGIHKTRSQLRAVNEEGMGVAKIQQSLRGLSRSAVFEKRDEEGLLKNPQKKPPRISSKTGEDSRLTDNSARPSSETETSKQEVRELPAELDPFLARQTSQSGKDQDCNQSDSYNVGQETCQFMGLTQCLENEDGIKIKEDSKESIKEDKRESYASSNRLIAHGKNNYMKWVKPKKKSTVEPKHTPRAPCAEIYSQRISSKRLPNAETNRIESTISSANRSKRGIGVAPLSGTPTPYKAGGVSINDSGVKRTSEAEIENNVVKFFEENQIYLRSSGELPSKENRDDSNRMSDNIQLENTQRRYLPSGNIQIVTDVEKSPENSEYQLDNTIHADNSCFSIEKHEMDSERLKKSVTFQANNSSAHTLVSGAAFSSNLLNQKLLSMKSNSIRKMSQPQDYLHLKLQMDGTNNLRKISGSLYQEPWNEARSQEGVQMRAEDERVPLTALAGRTDPSDRSVLNSSGSQLQGNHLGLKFNYGETADEKYGQNAGNKYKLSTYNLTPNNEARSSKSPSEIPKGIDNQPEGRSANLERSFEKKNPEDDDDEDSNKRHLNNQLTQKKPNPAVEKKTRRYRNKKVSEESTSVKTYSKKQRKNQVLEELPISQKDSQIIRKPRNQDHPNPADPALRTHHGQLGTRRTNGNETDLNKTGETESMYRKLANTRRYGETSASQDDGLSCLNSQYEDTMTDDVLRLKQGTTFSIENLVFKENDFLKYNNNTSQERTSQRKSISKATIPSVDFGQAESQRSRFSYLETGGTMSTKRILKLSRMIRQKISMGRNEGFVKIEEKSSDHVIDLLKEAEFTQTFETMTSGDGINVNNLEELKIELLGGTNVEENRTCSEVNTDNGLSAPDGDVYHTFSQRGVIQKNNKTMGDDGKRSLGKHPKIASCRVHKEKSKQVRSLRRSIKEPNNTVVDESRISVEKRRGQHDSMRMSHLRSGPDRRRDGQKSQLEVLSPMRVAGGSPEQNPKQRGKLISRGEFYLKKYRDEKIEEQGKRTTIPPPSLGPVIKIMKQSNKNIPTGSEQLKADSQSTKLTSLNRGSLYSTPYHIKQSSRTPNKLAIESKEPSTRGNLYQKEALTSEEFIRRREYSNSYRKKMTFELQKAAGGQGRDFKQGFVRVNVVTEFEEVKGVVCHSVNRKSTWRSGESGLGEEKKSWRR